jgi:hypothetical protein
VGWDIDRGVVRASAKWVIGSHSLVLEAFSLVNFQKSLVLAKNLAPRGPRTGQVTYNRFLGRQSVLRRFAPCRGKPNTHVASRKVGIGKRLDQRKKSRIYNA